MNTFLPDTNVLFKIFAGDLAIKNYIENLDAVVDTTIYIECLQGSKSNYEKRLIEKYLSRFAVIPITPTISNSAIDLIRNYSNSHGLLLPDALIAATALINDLILITYNTADFSFIPNLKWQKPPI